MFALKLAAGAIAEMLTQLVAVTLLGYNWLEITS